MDIYQVSFQTKDGLVYHIVKIRNKEELEEIKEILHVLEGAGDVRNPMVDLIDEAGSISIDRWQHDIERMFGAIHKGRPDLSRIDERLDPETERDVRDLLVAAFEGGIGYWGRIDARKFPPGSKEADFKEGGRMQPRRPSGEQDYYHWSQLIPTFPGGQLMIREISEGQGATHILDLGALKRGLMLLKAKYPKKFKRAMEGDADSADADVFLQLALFGEVIYG